MPENNTVRGLTDEHRDYLRSQAIDTDLAESLGVRSLTSRDDTKDLGGVWVNWANFPAILFPWTNDDGETTYQVRPDEPTIDGRGRARKYVFAKDMTPVLWAVKTVRNPRLVAIVEGTKQGLAAASYAPDDVAVYSMAGIRSWQKDGQPIADLYAVDGHDVVVVPDADAASNPEVYRAGVELAEALVMEGATSVTFSRLSGGSKAGLDDVLAGRRPDRRRDYFRRILESARPKPADRVPRGKKSGGPDGEGEADRPQITVNDDRWEVINALTSALVERWDGTELFNRGGNLSRWSRGELHLVEKGGFNDLIQQTARTVRVTETNNGPSIRPEWPDANTMSSVLSRPHEFKTLDKISRHPFVRPDGSIVTSPGYDEQTRTMLLDDPVFHGMRVPERPSAAQIAAARDLILTEWLGDFPFTEQADRANVLAMILTPVIRDLVRKVPLAVLDGSQMGVGKNKIVDTMLMIYTGQASQPMSWISDADELRKQITAAFMTGGEFFVFDEAHTLEGGVLAKALTAETWSDRILGVSKTGLFPNKVTWISMGNNVVVKGDITRRVYRVSVRPGYANPQDRPSSTFRHPELENWVMANRLPLLTAILTLVRAWFAAGSPRPTKRFDLGSFEEWQNIVGGIIEVAGVAGFLDNTQAWRSESDFETGYWTGHLAWLRDQFGDATFRTSEVLERTNTARADYIHPPEMDDLTDKGYGRKLGQAYHKIIGRRFEGLWIERAGTGPGHVALWKVHAPDNGGDGGQPETPDPGPVDEDMSTLDGCGCSRVMPVYCHVENCQGGADIEKDTPQGVDKAVDNVQAGEVMTSKTDILSDYKDPHRGVTVEGSITQSAGWCVPRSPDPVNVVTFDLETGDASDLHKTGPGFVRIGATALDDREVTAYPEPAAWNVAADLIQHRDTAVLTGHNIMAFDLPALVNENVLSMPDLHEWAADGRVFDTLLAARYVDPPMARAKGVAAERKYDLATLGQTYQLGEKLTGVSKPLEKKYGSWAHIPTDVNDPDPERAQDAADFIGYMRQDVELSRRLHAALMDKLGGTVPEYLVREHRVAALAAQISHNGFLVDQPLLAERLAGVTETKAVALGWLAEHAGLSLTDPKGNPYKSPLASKAGKESIGAALVAAGVPERSLWRTPKSGDLQLSADAMLHYSREYGQEFPQVKEIAKAVYRIVGARSVYQTATDNLCPDGRVHSKIGFDQATGRWSVTAPGMTVFGKRGGRHVERAIFIPEPGYVVLAADLSQVDMRAVAGLSQDQAYIEMLKSDDPHSELATALFGSVSFREQAKAIGHGWNYGESLRRISEDNEIAPDLVKQFDRSMRDRFPRLVEWRDEVRALGETGALLDNGFGRRMRPDPARSHTQSPALLGQGCARDLMMQGLLRLPGEILPLLRTQVHDEIVLVAPEDQADEVGRAVVDALTFEWRGVPILADVSKPGRSWAGCYEK